MSGVEIHQNGSIISHKSLFLEFHVNTYDFVENMNTAHIHTYIGQNFTWSTSEN